MRRISRPLDPNAVAAADDRIYSFHQNDPRPNALFNANGERLRLSGADPAQEALREQWRQFYLEAKDGPQAETNTPDSLASSKPSQKPASQTPPAFSGQPVSKIIQPCSLEKTHRISLYLRRFPDLDSAPPWWPSLPTDYYANETYSATITDGPRQGSLDGAGYTSYDSIPAGVCQFQFVSFYQDIKQYFKEHLK